MMDHSLNPFHIFSKMRACPRDEILTMCEASQTSHQVSLTLLWLQGSKSVENVDVLAKVYRVHCQTLRVVSAFTGQKLVDRLWLVKALSGIVEGDQNDSQTSQKCLCAHLGQQ